MHHENTANKLRPKAFNELSGQEFVVSTICSSIEQDNIAPAYLFSGPRGVGKTSAARLVALSINRPEGTPIDNLSYEGSEDIRLGKALDVIEIDGASYTSVENIRNIREEIMYAPVHFRYKVYIIDEVHMLSNSAFNALLKTIEEPPAYVVFIFATTELHKVPATIKSRCQQFSFRLISASEIIKRLSDICRNEGITVENAALQWIAKEAQGSFRDAYTLFDQIKAFSNNNISLESIKSHLGLAGLDVLNQVFMLCLEGKRKETLEVLNDLFAQGVAIEQFVIESAEYARNLLLLKSNIESTEMIGFAPELFEKKIYEGFSTEQLERALALLLECYRNLRYSINTKFEVELVFAQLSELSVYLTPQELVSQLRDIKSSSVSNKTESRAIEQTKTSTEETTQETQDIGKEENDYDYNYEQSYSQEEASSSSFSSTESEVENNIEHDSQMMMNEISHAENLSESFVETKDMDVDIIDEEITEEIEEKSFLWERIVSDIMTTNESLALALDSAIATQKGNSIYLTFREEYSYKRYLSVEEKIKSYGTKVAGDEIFVEATLEGVENGINSIEAGVSLEAKNQEVKQETSISETMASNNSYAIDSSNDAQETVHVESHTEKDALEQTTETVLNIFGGEVKD